MKKRRLIAVVCLSYLAAWAGTAVLGGRAARRVVLARYGDGIELVDEHPEDSSLAVTIEYAVPMPFLVRVSTDYRGAIWCGEGADWTLFALPGRAWIVGKRVKWIS